MPTPPAARGITPHMSRSRNYLFCILPHGFSRKQETAHSPSLHEYNNIPNLHLQS